MELPDKELLRQEVNFGTVVLVQIGESVWAAWKQFDDAPEHIVTYFDQHKEAQEHFNALVTEGTL